ncbi:MAG: WYL domain-containing transcriptional regulator [Gammaproteobacteria bacterium]|nr:WYL domain-containing transcriptional regulator [Gammaproteobacteria bacterium]
MSYKASREGEDAVETLQRRLDILMMFSRKDQELSLKDIIDRLRHLGHTLSERSVARNLDLLEQAGLLEVITKKSNDDYDDDNFFEKEDALPRKGCKWRWPVGLDSRIKVLPKFSVGEVIAFRLMDLLLKPLLPQESYAAIQPYLMAIHNQCKILPQWDRLKEWEKKVRVVPATQPLLPPQNPAQEAVREAILGALFRDLQCKIQYQQVWRDEPAEWVIHPLVYLQRGPTFYLLCTIEEFADVRQLALHRMLSAVILERPSKKPVGFDRDREVERSQGMGGSGEPVRLVTRFWRKAGSHLMETRLAEDQVIEDDEESDYYFWLTATVNDTAQLRWWLLSFGQHVEVFEPEALRAELANHAYWMHRRYSRPKGSPDMEAAPAPETGGTESTGNATPGAS